MRAASRLAHAWADPRVERQQPRIAAVASLLLHLLVLLLALLAPPVTVNSPEGAAGSTTYVDFVGQTPPTEEPPAEAAAASTPAQAAAARSRVQTTLVEQAEQPAPSEAPQTLETPRVTRNRRPQPPAANPTPAPPTAAPNATQGRAQASAGAPPPTRPSQQWGQPPGMLEQSTAPVHAGATRSPGISPGRGRDASSGASLQVGGYQVYYDLSSETRLRAWKEQGMEELFIPLPGTRDLMVCKLEIALTRDSGECRLLPPDSPELARIGDARQVIDMHRVYRRGELVWRGPRPYR